jgi:hypothetical protein
MQCRSWVMRSWQRDDEPPRYIFVCCMLKKTLEIWISHGQRSLIIARGDEFWWAGPIRARFVSFSSVTFFIIFEIFGEIKNTQIRKFYFWKTVQIENLFNSKYVHFRISCSNSEKMFKLKFVQIQICSNSNLFSFEFVQTLFCSDLNLFKLNFVEIRICSNLILFKRRFLNWTFFEFEQIFEYEQIFKFKQILNLNIFQIWTDFGI